MAGQEKPKRLVGRILDLDDRFGARVIPQRPVAVKADLNDAARDWLAERGPGPPQSCEKVQVRPPLRWLYTLIFRRRP